MSPEKWQSLKTRVQDSFKDCEFSQEKLEAPEIGEGEILEFTGPLGRMRLEYWTKPVVLGKNVSGSRRIGAHHEVEYVYSETEFTQTLKAYKWDDGRNDWEEIDLRGSFTL